jgi:hypothetical protein
MTRLKISWILDLMGLHIDADVEYPTNFGEIA